MIAIMLAIAILAAVAITLCVPRPTLARDDGTHGDMSPQMKEWFNDLASGKGLCCSFADGFSINDVDWDSVTVCDDKLPPGGAGNNQQTGCIGHYRVYLHGEWIVIPESAVIAGPNKFGPAVVWPYMDSDGATQIRCFLPGAGT